MVVRQHSRRSRHPRPPPHALDHAATPFQTLAYASPRHLSCCTSIPLAAAALSLALPLPPASAAVPLKPPLPLPLAHAPVPAASVPLPRSSVAAPRLSFPRPLVRLTVSVIHSAGSFGQSVSLLDPPARPSVSPSRPFICQPSALFVRQSSVLRPSVRPSTVRLSTVRLSTASLSVNRPSVRQPSVCLSASVPE